jgi:hypothetical protein
MYARKDLFGRSPWHGTNRFTLGQGCSVPTDQEPAQGQVPITAVQATSGPTPGWVYPVVATGGLAAIAAALFAFDIL